MWPYATYVDDHLVGRNDLRREQVGYIMYIIRFSEYSRKTKLGITSSEVGLIVTVVFNPCHSFIYSQLWWLFVFVNTMILLKYSTLYDSKMLSTTMGLMNLWSVGTLQYPRPQKSYLKVLEITFSLSSDLIILCPRRL